MHFNLPIIVSLIFVLFTTLLSCVSACSPPSNVSSEGFTIGNDGPADPETLGYSLNHFGLLVNDLDASVHFYSKVLGMRHVFTYRASDYFELVYLSYSQGGHNGTGFQTGEALFAQKTNTEGQLELIAAKSNSTFLATTQRVSTFSHIGLIVPDITSMQERMLNYGVPILKKTGEDFENNKTELAASMAYGSGSDLQRARITMAQLNNIGVKEFLFVTDPDGNLLEIQPQVL